MLSPSLDRITLRQPRPADAEAWVSFLAREQARTYADLVPESFEHAAAAEANVEDSRATFADPGDRNLLIAEHEGVLVGVAATVPAPADWEVALGYVPAPADRVLARLYVAPAWHGTGLAATLFDRVIDDRAHYLWLIDANARAGRFYERRGFRHLPEQFTAGAHWGGIGMHRMLRDAR